MTAKNARWDGIEQWPEEYSKRGDPLKLNPYKTTLTFRGSDDLLHRLRSGVLGTGCRYRRVAQILDTVGDRLAKVILQLFVVVRKVPDVVGECQLLAQL